MKVTTPTEMKPDLSQLEDAVRRFEEQWKDEEKGLPRYHLVIEYELNKATCRKIEEIYKKAGWSDAKCKTSFENGERAGLTGLILEIKD